MSLNTVTITWNISDFRQVNVTDSCTFLIAPTNVLADSADSKVIAGVTRTVTFTGGTGSITGVIANDNSNLAPSNTAYNIQVYDNVTGNYIVGPFTAAVNFSNGATQDLSFLYEEQIPASAGYFQYVTLQALQGLVDTYVAPQLGTCQSVLAFSADPTGAADSTAAFNSAITACTGTASPSSNTRTAKGWLYIPAGTYKITSDLLIQSVSGLIVRGDGEGASNLVASGTGFTSAVLLVDGAQNCSFSDFSVSGDGSEGAGASPIPNAVSLTKTSGSLSVSTKNSFERILIKQFNWAGGFTQAAPGSSTSQVDATTVRGVTVQGGGSASFSYSTKWLTGFQTGNGTAGNQYNFVFYNCHASGVQNGGYCNASGLEWYGGEFGANAVDFHILPNAQLTIEGIQSNASARFLQQNAGSSSSYPCSARDIQFISSAGAGDGKWISLSSQGRCWELSNIQANVSNVSPVIAFSGGSNPELATLVNVSQNNTLASGVTTANGGSVVIVNYTQINSSNQIVTTTPLAGQVFTATGLTGAVAATRYAGGTAAGAPSSGTFATGDFVIDQKGAVWICTSGGSPGTWAAGGLAANTWTLDSFGAGSDDANMASALAQVVSAGSGTILLPARTLNFASAWSTAYVNSTTTSKIRILGAGAAVNGEWSTTSAATNCVFTCTGVTACMNFHHLGGIELADIRFSNANTGTPLFQTTNAQPKIHDCIFAGGGSGTNCTTDAIVLGGTTTATNGTDTAQYQGYQGLIWNNFFDGIRRVCLWQVSANATLFTGNTISATCGTSTWRGAPLEFNAPAGNTFGNFVVNNCIEVTNYYHGIRITNNAISNTLGPNGFYDMSSSFISCVHVTTAGTSAQNVVIDGGSTQGGVTLLEDLGGSACNNAVMGIASRAAGKNNIINSGYAFQYNAAPPAVFFFGVGAMGFNGHGDGGGLQTVDRSPGSSTPPSVQVCYQSMANFTDGNITNGSVYIFSATAAFAAGDRTQVIGGTGIGSQTYIQNVFTTSTIRPWAASTVFSAGDMIRPVSANGKIYQATTGGTSGSSQPSFPTTTGATVTDNTVTWTCLGAGTVALMSGPASATTAGTLAFGISRPVTQPYTLGPIFEGTHIRGYPTAVNTITAGPAFGSGASASFYTGSDLAITVLASTGTGTTTGVGFTVNWVQNYSAAPSGVSITPMNAAAQSILAGGNWYLTVSTTYVKLNFTSAPTASVSNALFSIMAIQ